MQDGQPLQGVNVALIDLSGELRGGVTDDDGFFIVVRLQPGQYTLRASYIGYTTILDTLILEPNASERLTLRLQPSEELSDELVVSAEREGGATIAAGLQTVRPRDIELVPTTDVSGDLVSYLATMPGVVSIGDRGGQVFIRGGEPSHNLSLLGRDVCLPALSYSGFLLCNFPLKSSATRTSTPVHSVANTLGACLR